MVGYDDPAGFRGQLQRGRGLAVRRARSEPGAADAVYECVIEDPRWDRQVERRTDYLAGLVRLLELPLAPLEDHLAAFDADVWDLHLLLNVLAELTAAGRADADAVLRRHIVGGRYWSAALDAVMYAHPGGWDGFADLALAVRSDDELRDAADDSWLQELMRWRPEVRRFSAEEWSDPAGQRSDSHRQWVRTLRDRSQAELVRMIREQSWSRRWAVEELGRRQDPLVLDLVEEEGLRSPAGWLPGSGTALRRLGVAAVTRARTWVAAGHDSALTSLGVGVLADMGDHSDVPVLMAEVRLAFDDPDLWCAAEHPAKGLGRLGVAEAEPLLREAWGRTVHSYGRGAFLTGLRGCAPRAARELAEEGLEDCEPTVREIAREICSAAG